MFIKQIKNVVLEKECFRRKWLPNGLEFCVGAFLCVSMCHRVWMCMWVYVREGLYSERYAI